MSLTDRVASETRIGALKLLAIEANKDLPDGKKIVGFAKFKLEDIEKLRKLILASIGKPVLRVSPSKKGDLSQVNSISTLSGLKEMARMLRIPGYSKYNAAQKEDLRRLIINHIGGSVTPRKVSSKKASPKKASLDLEDQVRSIKTISGLIKIVAGLGIPGYNKYKLAQIEDLRRKALEKMGSKPGVAPVVVVAPPKPAKKSDEEGLDGCLLATPVKKLATTPQMDYDSFSSERHQAKSMPECLAFYGIFKSKRFGAGTYGQTFLADYKGQSTVFKIVDLEQSEFGLEGFKWECVIAERAAKIGVGPAIVAKGICYDKGSPQYGIIGMGRCKPISMSASIPKKDFPQLVELISILHKHGITHRDLGVRNVMKSGSRYVFIDYGLAMAYPGPVPREMELFDYAYLMFDVDGTDWYATKLSVKDRAIYNRMLDSWVVAEEYTTKYFPIYMLKTLGVAKAGYYLNKLSEGDADDTRLMAQLRARFRSGV